MLKNLRKITFEPNTERQEEMTIHRIVGDKIYAHYFDKDRKRINVKILVKWEEEK
jgi:hypothetical protein